MAFPSLLGWLNRTPCGPGRLHPKRPKRVPLARQAFVPRLEALEDRTVPSTFTVTTLADDGPGSLRAAITAANANPGADAIRFAGGLKGTITLASELNITDDLTINGSSPQKVTVSGKTTRVFHVSGGATELAISGLTIADGRASVAAGNAFGGGLLNEGASVSLSHVVLTGNQAVG